MASLVGSGNRFNFDGGPQLPPADQSIWNIDEDDVLTFDDLYGMEGPIDLTTFDDPNVNANITDQMNQSMQGPVPDINNYIPTNVPYPNMKTNFQLPNNLSSSIPMLPTQGNDAVHFSQTTVGSSRADLRRQPQQQLHHLPQMQQQQQQQQPHQQQQLQQQHQQQQQQQLYHPPPMQQQQPQPQLRHPPPIQQQQQQQLHQSSPDLAIQRQIHQRPTDRITQQPQQQTPAAPKQSYPPLPRYPSTNCVQNSPAQPAPKPDKVGPFSPTTESAMVTFVDLKPFYEKGQCRLQGKSEQRLDYACSFVRIYLAKPENIKAKAAFVERSPDAAHILKDNVGRVPLKILPDESSSWIKVNLDDAGSEVYKLSKVKGEERNRFRIVVELLFSDTNQRKAYYSDTFQVKSKPKTTDIYSVDIFEDGEKPSIKMEPDIKKKAIKRSRTEDSDMMTSSPLSVGSTVFPEVITDHLQATTANIEQLRVNQPIQTQRGDVAYHFKLSECPSDQVLEEGDVIGFFDNGKGKTEIRPLTCENVHSAKLAGIISRSAWIEGKTPEDKEKDPTDVVCVIGVVKVKVRGPVQNGERIYASLSSFPGVAMPENVITQVTSNDLTLVGQSLESVLDSPPDRVNLVSSFVSILLSIQTKHTTKAMSEMRTDVMGDVDTKIAKAKRKLIRGLRWKVFVFLIFCGLLGVLLYQLYAPSTAYRYWKCKKGSISDSTSSFTFHTNNLQVAKVKGVEFKFDDLMDKLDLSPDTPRKEKERYSAGHRYYMNVDRCAAGGLKSGVHGPQFYVINAECNTAYYLHPNGKYQRYRTGKEFLCSFNPASKDEQELANDQIKKQKCAYLIDRTSYNASFSYISSSTKKVVNASGVLVTFDVLKKKNSYRLEKLGGSDRGVRYFFNIEKCMGIAGGPKIFAIQGPQCNNAYYYSNGYNNGWVKYNSAKNVQCFPPFELE